MLGRVYTAVPAAGSAFRMGLGYSKAYVDVAGRPLLAWTLDALLESSFIDRIAVAVRPGEVALARAEIIEKLGYGEEILITGGGEGRQKTVGKLLEAAPAGRDIVLIHDGARPLVGVQLIEEVLDAAAEWGAAVAAVPVTDTVKESTDGGETVTGTVDRRLLYRAQTPQGFHRDLLSAAYRRARKEGWEGTDEASLVERMGHKVRIVRGEERNIKVTTMDDLELVRWIIQGRGF